jgi:hypothetical protein
MTAEVEDLRSKRKPREKRQPPTVVVGLPALHLLAGRADQHEAPTQVVVVEPIAVREDLCSAMTGYPVETLRGFRKTRTGLLPRKQGAICLYYLEDIHEHFRKLPRLASA